MKFIHAFCLVVLLYVQVVYFFMEVPQQMIVKLIIIFGGVYFVYQVQFCVLHGFIRKKYNKILKFGTILDAIVILRSESIATHQVNLIVTYILEGKETPNMLLDSFNNDCSLDVGDIIKVCVYKDKAILIEEN